MGMYDYVQAKRDYRDICKTSEGSSIQVFAQPWFLDAVCEKNDDWQVIICKQNNSVIGAFPFKYVKDQYGLWTITNPFQAHRLGIWINYNYIGSKESIEHYEDRISKYIIDNLPQFDVFQIIFDARYTNWREFYYAGFSQTTQYSYVIKSGSSIDEYEMRLNKSKRQSIKTAYKHEYYVDTSEISFSEYWDFFTSSYKKRGRVASYGKLRIKRLYNAALTHGALKLYTSKYKGIVKAVHVVFYDNQKHYSMYGTFEPNDSRFTRVPLTHHAILDAINSNRSYDFEGSMIPGVAKYNQEFGAIQEPYFIITKYSEKARLMRSAKGIASSIKNIVN